MLFRSHPQERHKLPTPRLVFGGGTVRGCPLRALGFCHPGSRCLLGQGFPPPHPPQAAPGVSPLPSGGINPRAPAGVPGRRGAGPRRLLLLGEPSSSLPSSSDPPPAPPALTPVAPSLLSVSWCGFLPRGLSPWTLCGFAPLCLALTTIPWGPWAPAAPTPVSPRPPPSQAAPSAAGSRPLALCFLAVHQQWWVGCGHPASQELGRVISLCIWGGRAQRRGTGPAIPLLVGGGPARG